MRILDLGASDGWMLENLSTLDIEITALDGVELNPTAATKAQERVGNRGTIVCDDLHRAPEHFDKRSYDAVALFEVIEHVPDPRATLDVCVRMCKPDGRIYVSTPEGAFEHGDLPNWMQVEHKGHLRALRASDLARLLCERGVVDEMNMQQGVTVARLRPEPRKGRVIFYAGAVEALPEKILTEGLGGSETALCKMAEHFARRSYDVRVYAGEGGGIRGDHISVDEETMTGQVLYLPSAAWDPGEGADLFVSSRIPEVFDRTIVAARRVLWLHDADYGERVTPERIERTTDVLVMSEFQQDLLSGRYPYIKEKIRVTRNGIEPKLFKRLPKTKKPWCVYSSSPDRGLDVLFELWPEIKKRVPEAELHATYAPIYGQFRQVYPHLATFHERLEGLAKADGVVWHKSMNQKELARLYAKSRAWTYPSWTEPLVHDWFPEIHCISALEAQAAGCIPVTTDHAALKETVRSGARIPPHRLNGSPSPKWRQQFIDQVVRALTDDEWLAESRKTRHWAMKQDWAGVADQWEAWFLQPSEIRERIPA